ncbi:MAG: 4Fe-4S binding protein [Theionarchaea archaeon]|nr:4Fe-4S binding protein [Theionarchaea archaeon]
MKLLLLKEKCNQCGNCVRICHKGPCIFDINKKEIKDMEYCNACLLCVSICPENALQVL